MPLKPKTKNPRRFLVFFMQFSNYNIIGTDVSFYQGHPPAFPVTDFRKMREYGMSFTIIRAGQRTWEDPAFKYNWQAAKGILPRHSYWHYDNQDNPKRQAELYWDILKSDFEGKLWLDLEGRLPGDFAGWKHWHDFLERLKSYSDVLTDDDIGIYTGEYYWKEYTQTATKAEKEYFGRYKLWFASYRNNPLNPDFENIVIPFPWTDFDCLMIQTGTPVIGREVGVSSEEIDYNVFNGDKERFRRYFPVVTPIPDQGEPQMPAITGKAKKTSTPNTRVRKAKNDGSPDPSDQTLAGILPEQSFEADKTGKDSFGETWVHITKIGNKVLDVPGWSAGFLLDYKEQTEPGDGGEDPGGNPDPTPDPVKEPITITQKFEMSGYETQTVVTVLRPTQ